MSFLSFKVKCGVAVIFDALGINNKYRKEIFHRYGNNYIRVVNYHNTKDENKANFIKQAEWYSKHYDNVTYDDFELFMSGQKHFDNKPGIMLTFDDGLIGNKLVAKEVLEKYGFTGYFFVSSDLIGESGYMSCDDLKELIQNKHIIGCHTATHHRMNVDDSKDVLNKEIVESKKKLEAILSSPIDIFCWVGGEEEHYTKNASDMIKEAGYKYSFMTNSDVLVHGCNPLQIQRTNIEDSWSMSLVKLQLSGFQDKRYKKKRERVNQLTG